MSSKAWIFAIIAVIAFLYLTQGFHSGGNDTIEYHGEHFKMAKNYSSYEDYKDDPNNLDTNELPHIESVMRGASIGTNFDTRKQFIHAMFDLKFPGYGLEQFGEKSQPDGSGLSMFSVEIPQRGKDRYLVARTIGGRYILADDFVTSSVSNSVAQVKLESMRLRYFDANGLLVREHQLSQ